MNPLLSGLQPYPFEKLTALLAGSKPSGAKKPILWSIGEPKHAAPAFIAEIIEKEISGLGSYPLTAGSDDLRTAIRSWLCKRFNLAENSLDPNKHVLPCNGTREALFAFAQAVVDPSERALVLMPNPFYQIYEGAAILAGAQPYFINLGPDLCPDFDAVPENIWQRCRLLYLSTPGNPSGAVLSLERLQKLISLAERYDFILASDECYSEIYSDENNPPAGLLEAAAKMGNIDYKRCLVFHSLSKRSSLPGMRSGFVAGDAEIIAKFKLYRTYHGCAMSPPFQKASAAAWRDEEHVKVNRAIYRQKFQAVIDIVVPVLPLQIPAGSFYLWAQTPCADTEFAKLLYEKENLTVLPGSYLSRVAHGTNPGANRVRMALVAPLAECIEGAQRLKEFVSSL
ncbi:MAG: succinyldiaminopimelate transaminase [Candidatus Obscuribacterales bacterium]|nr:succinyldiaminopimelate transaminase [Candidatus Obscuribacterales bacterium]